MKQLEVQKAENTSQSKSKSEVLRKGTAIVVLAENFGKPMSDSLAALWLKSLRQFSAEQVEAGVQRLIERETYKTLPPLAKLLQAIREASGMPSPVERRQSLEMQAEAEWSNLREKISSVGSYGNPYWEDQTTLRVVRALGGWKNICGWLTSEMQWRRKEFLDMWLTYAEGGEAMDGGAEGVRLALAQRETPEAVENREIPSGFLKRIQ